MLLYIVRHGIPNYATDSLTEDGKEQAEAVARRLVKSGIEEIYSSPLGRAKQTAQPTCDALGLGMKIIPFMSENEAYSHFSHIDENGKDTGWCFYRRKLFLGDNSCFENPEDFGRGYYSDDKAKEGINFIKKGSDEFLLNLGYEKTGIGNGYKAIGDNEKHIAAFCHQGFGLHWISYLLNMPFHLFTASFDISHTGLTIIKFSPEKGSDIAYPICLCLSDLSHIYADGLPMLYHNELKI